MVQNLNESTRAQFSNHLWCLVFSFLDPVVEDVEGAIMGRPSLTVVSDVYSSCIAGYNLSFEEPDSQISVLAMQHAVLPKNYSLEYGLYNDWAIYGVPQMLMVDASKALDSMRLRHSLEEFGIRLIQRRPVSQRNASERFLDGFCREIKSFTRLTFSQLDRLLVRYIVDHYNQLLDPRDRNKTRFQLWQSGLVSTPKILSVGL